MPFSYLHYTGVCRCEGSRTGGGRVCRSVTYIIQVFVVVKGVELEVAGFAVQYQGVGAGVYVHARRESFGHLLVEERPRQTLEYLLHLEVIVDHLKGCKYRNTKIKWN